ncbi:phosphoserine phosphatase-like [Parasteatoda tepidariorum]|uniref:phosphoserine phosphatase-like n=1 Tax=Parasteatoda tepidariorum TaxID=114398 RepID=UPI001C71E5C7|nr:phosphoserine phosphatase-like [Parasteatoda tepidariorum]XP_042894763.1 phosphoserine phosphatase-like [Parasteatoda tepidariorum]
MSVNEARVRNLWRAADAVCFDVDSTVCMDEAIDEIAKFANKEKEVVELTLRAMRGGMTFREALAKRLEIIQPTTDLFNDFLRSHPPRLTPGIKELVAELHARGVSVYLVSGGFHAIIDPVANILEIPVKNVFANSLKFYFNGEFAGFDENEPTSHQEGKAEVIAYLKHRFGYRCVIMIGDGATDLTACPPAEGFIGFGGNQVRDRVKEKSEWFVTSFNELLTEIRRM